MTDALTRSNSAIRIPSFPSETISPIAKILKIPDLLSLVLTCLEWNPMRSSMGTCRDFAHTVKKIVSNEMRKTTDLEPVFHKYVCWFVHKKYKEVPRLHPTLRTAYPIFDQIVSREITKLNTDPNTERSSFLQTGVKSTIPVVSALVAKIFASCPNLTTFDLEFFNPNLEKGFRKHCFSYGEVLLEVLKFSHRFHRYITDLNLGPTIVVANTFFAHGQVYSQLSRLSLEIEEVRDLEAASLFIPKFPKLNSVHVSFTDNDQNITREDLLRLNIPHLTSIGIWNNQMDIIPTLAEKYPHLKKLSMYVGATFRKKHFQVFTQYFHQLTCLQINGPQLYDTEALGYPVGGQSECGDEGLQIIGDHCKKLTEVAFNLGSGIRVITVINLCRQLPGLTSFTSLSDNFTMAQAIELIKAAPKLTQFVFNLIQLVDSQPKITRVQWENETLEKLRQRLKEEKEVPFHKRKKDDLMEEKSQPPELPNTQVLDDTTAPTQVIEETTPKAKKARKEE